MYLNYFEFIYRPLICLPRTKCQLWQWWRSVRCRPAHPRRAKSEPRMRPSQPESWRWCPMKKNPLLLRGLTQVLGILQIIKGNSYSTSSRKLRVVDLNPKTAISPFETTVVWEYNLPEIMYQGGWLLQVGSIISGYFVAWA